MNVILNNIFDAKDYLITFIQNSLDNPIATIVIAGLVYEIKGSAYSAMQYLLKCFIKAILLSTIIKALKCIFGNTNIDLNALNERNDYNIGNDHRNDSNEGEINNFFQRRSSKIDSDNLLFPTNDFSKLDISKKNIDDIFTQNHNTSFGHENSNKVSSIKSKEKTNDLSQNVSSRSATSNPFLQSLRAGNVHSNLTNKTKFNFSNKQNQSILNSKSDQTNLKKEENKLILVEEEEEEKGERKEDDNDNNDNNDLKNLPKFVNPPPLSLFKSKENTNSDSISDSDFDFDPDYKSTNETIKSNNPPPSFSFRSIKSKEETNDLSQNVSSGFATNNPFNRPGFGYSNLTNKTKFNFSNKQNQSILNSKSDQTNLKKEENKLILVEEEEEEKGERKEDDNDNNDNNDLKDLPKFVNPPPLSSFKSKENTNSDSISDSDFDFDPDYKSTNETIKSNNPPPSFSFSSIKPKEKTNDLSQNVSSGFATNNPFLQSDKTCFGYSNEIKEPHFTFSNKQNQSILNSKSDQTNSKEIKNNFILVEEEGEEDDDDDFKDLPKFVNSSPIKLNSDKSTEISNQQYMIPNSDFDPDYKSSNEATKSNESHLFVEPPSSSFESKENTNSDSDLDFIL